MFTKKSHADVKKSICKIQDSKKDSATRLRHLKTILEHVDHEEAKSLFESNYSHVYYILYDTFVQAENNLKQRVHKAHREELDGSLWLLGKILCLLPELIARRWQCHSLGRIMSKLLHHGNNSKLRKEGVRYFLLWYQTLAENAPNHVHAMFMDLIPGLILQTKNNLTGLTIQDTEFTINDYLNHPNIKGELGTSVFHDTCVHPVKIIDIQPLLQPSQSDKIHLNEPKDGLDILLESMVYTIGLLKWRDNGINQQKHLKSFQFLLQRFKDVYLNIFCPNYDITTSIYDPKLDLPIMRSINKRDDITSSCIVVIINWLSKYTHDKINMNRLDNIQIDIDEQNFDNINNYYTQTQLVRDVLYLNRDNINFVHEMYRQAFLLSFTTKSQIDAMRIAISVYRDWMTIIPPPPFLLEPDDASLSTSSLTSNDTIKVQRLRTDSYLGAISKENLLIRAGLQNVLQIFITNASNVFMVSTGHLNIIFPSKTKDISVTPLDEQTDICKRVLNMYRTMVMNTRMDCKTWEQLLLVLLQITSIILNNDPPNSKKNNLGGRLAQAIFQTLIVTWIRAHTNVQVNKVLWEKFLNVLSSLTYREELIIEWDKTMQTLTRVLARHVYNINLQDLPLDRLAEQKTKGRRRIGPSSASAIASTTTTTASSSSSSSTNLIDNQEMKLLNKKNNKNINKIDENDEHRILNEMSGGNIPGTPSLNRSYSEGSLAPSKKMGGRRQLNKSNHINKLLLPQNVENSLNRIILNQQSCISSDSTQNEHSTLRRALSLDSIRLRHSYINDLDDDSQRGSRSPSPTVSSGIEGGSIKDSPMQIEMMAGDTSSIDTQDDGTYLDERRSILSGGCARGWLPDVAAIMWRRMLGSLGDVNKILNPKLHAQVFKHLVDMTDSLIKIKMNQGISNDNQSTPEPPNLVPPIAIVTPWCYGALSLESQYRKGKLSALQLLCMIVKNGTNLGNDQLPLFYHAIHQALTGEDRAMASTVLKYLGGSRFLSLLLPGHTLLLLDLVHASTVILTSSEAGSLAPRAEAISLLGSLLCFPKSSLPKPVLQPSEPNVELMECPDLQEHILNIVLRCARREQTSKARCIALASLGHWVLHNLTNPIIIKQQQQQQYSFQQKVPHKKGQGTTGGQSSTTILNSRITEVIQVILQALQFKHRTIARTAAEILKLLSEKGLIISKIERLPLIIINSICIALEIQNITHPKESDKLVITSLLLCLGELCMSLPIKLLLTNKTNDTYDEHDNILLNVLKILHEIGTGKQTNRIKLFTPDEDFEMSITVDDVREQMGTEASYQTSETTQNCLQGIRLCAKTILMHLITNLSHFPMGIGASRLSSLVDEQDDLLNYNLTTIQQQQQQMLSNNRDNTIDLNLANVLNSTNVQMFMLTNGLITSFIELPRLKLPGGGITAGLITANRQVRVLLRDLSGKACWDASILYREPHININNHEAIQNDNQYYFNNSMNLIQNNKYNNSCNMGASLDPLISSVDMIHLSPLRHTLRHRPPQQLPLAKDMAPDLDQLDDLLQYIGHTSPECLNYNTTPLNVSGPTPLGLQTEAQTISIILNQRTIENEYIKTVQHPSTNVTSASSTITSSSINTDKLNKLNNDLSPFHYCRLLFSQLGLAGWERRKRTHLLNRTDKLIRELKNLDTQRCRETHKMAVIYVGSGQEDKNSILKNGCGSSTYELFVSALGWEVELESHHGFLGGLPRQGCGLTAPYYATPFLEVIYHVATRMPSDTSESILNKTRHLGNDEVHIVWSEHYRDYRRDILPTEFCDVLITVYPLKSGLFRVTVNRKPDVPWFGPLWDEAVIGGSCLASLVRATAINASRAKRSSLPFYQQFYEERNRSLDTVASRHKERNTFEDFSSRVFNPVQPQNLVSQNSSNISGGSAPLAAALIDHQKSTTKNWSQHTSPEIMIGGRNDINLQQQQQQQQMNILTSITLDHPSPRPLRKLHPFKSSVHRQKLITTATGASSSSSSTSASSSITTTSTSAFQQQSLQTPPDSPTLPGRKFK